MDDSKCVLIASSNIVQKYGRKYNRCFALPDNAKDCASVLYSTMRDADAVCKGFKNAVIVICTEGIHAEEGCGFMAAIKDKIFRASEEKEINLLLNFL